MGFETDQFFSNFESELSQFIKARTPAYLREAVSSGCFIYGAGSYGRRIASLLRQNDIPCLGIIDRKFNASTLEIDGLPAIHPASFKTSDAAGYSLVIGVHNQEANLAEIIAFGGAFSFREILWNSDLPDILGPGADNYWLTNRQFLLDHFHRCKNVIELFSDESSVNTFTSLIRYRILGSCSDLLVHKITEQYMPPDLFHFNTPITLVDGGAYDGDTYRHLLSKNVEITHWIAFEPDPKNFASLAAFASTQDTQITLFPCGLSQDFAQVSFSANEGTSSHLSSEVSRMTIPCVALDDVIQGRHVDYIKLDIEGAEKDALFGMKKTIARSRPHLAISGYHRPEDLWIIAETLAELAPYAKLYMRQHSLNAFETVIYAVPMQ